MKYILGLFLIWFSTSAFTQNSCYTNCMAYQSNNPGAGEICTTTCDGGQPAPNVMDSFRQGYENGAAIRRDRERNEMINRAKNDCNNGVQAGCEWLKRNNIY